MQERNRRYWVRSWESWGDQQPCLKTCSDSTFLHSFTECRCCEQLLRTQITEFAEQRLLGTDLRTSNPTKGLMPWHLTFWVTEGWQERKPGVKISAHASSWLAPYCRKKNLAKFQLVTRFIWAVRGAHPVGAAEVTSAPTAAELHGFTVIRELCRQQYFCYQVGSRALCYQLRTSKARWQKRQAT